MEEKQWFLYIADHHEGPYTVSEIKQKVKDGQAKESNFVWKDGFADWAMMSDVSEFGVSAAKPKSDSHGPHTFVADDGPKLDLGGVSASASVWCLSSNKVFSGPFSMKVIIKKLNERSAKPTDSVWKEGWTSFVPISNIPEFMRQIKPEAMKAEVALEKRKPTSGAAALGLAGKVSTVKRRWYHGKFFRLCVFVAALVGVYHALTTGMLDPMLEKANLKAKVKAMNLPTLQQLNSPAVQEKINTATQYLKPLKEFVSMGVAQVIPLLPPQVRTFFSPVDLPEGLSPRDVENLKAAAQFKPQHLVHVATALVAGDELSPSFVIASNQPDGTSFKIALKSKPDTLINARSYEKETVAVLQKQVLRTQPFTSDNGKALPKGEYQLTVSSNEKVLISDDYFLGGRKDAAYEAKLKEQNDSFKAKQTSEAEELKQAVLTLESIANESALQFFNLTKTALSPQKKKIWQQYHSKYSKMSAQLATVTAKGQGDKSQLALPDLYLRLFQTSQFVDKLHESQNNYMTSGDKKMMTNVQQQAANTANSINDLKQVIFKVIK